MTNTANLTDLLEAAKEGTITKNDIAGVAKKIKEISKDQDRSLYSLIHIMGRAKATEYQKLIEPFLIYPDNPNISKITLQSLCTYWNLTPKYLDELKMFIQGAAWDDFDDVRLVALSIAGEFLRTNHEKELLSLLIALFENQENNQVRPPENPLLIQSCAYYAIARAMGKDYNQIPSIDDIEEKISNQTLDLSVVEQAKKLR